MHKCETVFFPNYCYFTTLSYRMEGNVVVYGRQSIFYDFNILNKLNVHLSKVFIIKNNSEAY